MIIDSLLQVSSAQALTGNAASTDVIDLGTTRFIGPGEPMYWVIAARVGLTAGTLQVDIETDDAEGFPSATKLLRSQVLTSFVAGSRLVLPMTYTNERFMRLQYSLTGNVTVDGWLTNQEPETWKAFPDAID